MRRYHTETATALFEISNAIMGVILLPFVSIAPCCMGLETDPTVELNYK